MNTLCLFSLPSRFDDCCQMTTAGSGWPVLSCDSDSVVLLSCKSDGDVTRHLISAIKNMAAFFL